MANLTLTQLELTSLRFFRFVEHSGLDRSQAIGQLLLFWHQTRQASLHILDEQGVRAHLDGSAQKRAQVAAALQDAGYLLACDAGLEVVGNLEAIARLQERRARGSRGGAKKRVKTPRRKALSPPCLPTPPAVESLVPEGGEAQAQAVCRAIWQAYAQAYARKTTVQPVRNIKVNSLIRQIYRRIGADGPEVVRFYVEQVSERYIVQAMWPLDLFLSRAESYVTQWRLGRTISFAQAGALSDSAAYSQKQRDILDGRI